MAAWGQDQFPLYIYIENLNIFFSETTGQFLYSIKNYGCHGNQVKSIL